MLSSTGTRRKSAVAAAIGLIAALLSVTPMSASAEPNDTNGGSIGIDGTTSTPTMAAVANTPGSLRLTVTCSGTGQFNDIYYSLQTATPYTWNATSIDCKANPTVLTSDITGLTGNTAYTISYLNTAQTVNQITTSTAATGTLTATTAPAAPTGLSVARINGSATTATLSWTAVSGLTYSATSTPAGGTCGPTAASASTCTITGLAANTAYTFTLTPSNGTAGATATSGSVTTNPAAPTNSTLSQLGSSLSQAFTTVTGGTLYRATCTSGTAGAATPLTGTNSTTPVAVTGATGGASYSCTVAASNNAGTNYGPESGASSSLTFASAPGAPTAVSASSATATGMTVSWTAPSSNGGAAISSYTATSSPGGITCTSNSGSPITPSCTMTGLSNNTTYTFTVTATNSAGTSSPSSASTGVATLPGTVAATATGGNKSVSVSFPTYSAGTATVTGYRATCINGSTFTNTGSTSPIVVTGLSNNTSYTCSIAVQNASGYGAEGTTSAATTNNVPGAPTGVTASAPTTSQMTVSWTAPASTGGSSITRYDIVAVQDGTKTCNWQAGVNGATLTCDVTGLTANTSYTFTATATNVNGTSASSTASAAKITTPGQPTASATRGNTQISVGGTKSAGDGAATINRYRAACATSGTPTTSGSGSATTPVAVTGLTNGQSYNCVIAISNDGGTTWSADSAVATATPATTPEQPTAVSAGTATASGLTVSWTAPSSNGGDGVTSYTATSSPGSFTCTATAPATSCAVTGLSANTNYTFTVKATNTVGDSSASSASTSVPTLPGTTAATATKGNKSVSVAFTAYSTGNGTVTGYRATCVDGSSNSFTNTGSSSPIVVSGLSNNTSYACSIAVQNASGYGAEGTTSSATTNNVPSAPDKPGTIAGSGDGHVTVTWEAPANGGSAITSYTVYTYQAGVLQEGKTCTWTTGTLDCDITGLTIGTLYTFTVTATNTNGTSAESTPSDAVAPVISPDEVHKYDETTEANNFVIGNGQITVKWTLLSDTVPFNGGYSLASYTAQAYAAGVLQSGKSCTVSANATNSCTITGLTNGTAYTFKVIATNGANVSSSGAYTWGPATPLSTSGAPTGVTASSATVSQLTVSWTAPSNNGGATITRYDVTAVQDNSKTCNWQSGVNGATLTCNVTGLAANTNYTFYVTATNSQGTSSASSASSAVATLPDGMTTPTATKGNASISVAFDAYSGGTGTITGYRATCTGNKTATGSSSPLTVTGLTNGTAYTCTVAATNASGYGADSSASNSATPSTVPNAPNGNPSVTKGDQSISVGFNTVTGSSNGGATVTSYTATCVSSDEGATGSASGATSPITVGGLTNGKTYTCSVKAYNVNGFGPSGNASSSVVPAGAPFAPPNINVNNPNSGGASNKITISWGDATNPNNNGLYPVTAYDVQAYTDADTLIDKKKCGTNGAGRSCTITFANSASIAVKFCVVATNAIGSTGECSFVINTGSDAPGTVSNISTTAGNGSISVAFSKPSYTGVDGSGNPIPMDYYTVQARYNGAAVASCTVNQTGRSNRQLRCTITGLTNGTNYYFYITGYNTAGKYNTIAYYPATGYTGTTPNAALPTAPQNVVVQPGNSTAVVTWSAPSSQGTSAITTYTILNEDGTVNRTYNRNSNDAGPYTTTINGLTGSAPFVFSVYATNSTGNGVPSAYSTSTSNQATAVSGTRGDGQVTVSWTAPSYSGDGSITGYTVTSNPEGKTCTWTVGTGGSVQCDVTGLTNGTPYTFTVVVNSSVGSSQASAASSAVTPGAVPGAPTITNATAGNGSAAVTFTAAAANGYAVTNYQYQLNGSGGWTSFSPAVTAAGTVTITGLTNGNNYTVKLRAVNAVGTGTASVSSGSIKPVTAPSAPTGVSLTRGNGQLTLNFTPLTGSSTGGNTITDYRYCYTSSADNYATETCVDAGQTTSPITITGLTNGTTYKVKLRAKSDSDDGAFSSAATGTPSLADPVAPSAPTNLVATRGNGSVTVNFDSGDNGGSEITNYKYQLNGSGPWVAFSPAQTTSPVTISGLNNGSPYTVKLQAVNSVGNGSESDPSGSVTPATTPAAPTGVSASSGNGSLSVNYTPGNSNGDDITDYEYSLDDGDTWTSAGTSSPFSISGLNNGTQYSVRVRAVNGLGAGTASSAATGTPSTTPAAPSNIYAVRGNASGTVTFDLGDNGGSELTGLSYALSTNGGDTFGSFTSAGSTTSPITITGLTNGQAYKVKVRATNVAGNSAESDASNSFTPATAPSAPTSLVITRGDGQLSVAFTAPGSDGGESITNYQYSVDGGSTWYSANTTSSPVVITGLTNANTYQVRLRAMTENFTGAQSSEVSGTPGTTVLTVPGAPTNITATRGNTTGTIDFDPVVDDGGSQVTDYEYSLDGNTWTSVGTERPFTITGLTNGQSYTVRLRATNSVGTGSVSDPSNSFVPATVPGAPTIGTIKGFSTSLQVAFTAPASNGGSAITDYEYSLDGNTWSSAGTTSPFTITGLTADTDYTVRLRAVNAVGAGSAASKAQSTSYACGNQPAKNLGWSGRWVNIGPNLNGTVQLTDIACGVTKAQIDEVAKTMLPIYASWNAHIGLNNGYQGIYANATDGFAINDTITIVGIGADGNSDKGNGKWANSNHADNTKDSLYVEGTVGSDGIWNWTPWGCTSTGNRPVSIRLNGTEIFKLKVSL